MILSAIILYVFCTVIINAFKSEYCELPMKIGKCHGNFPRWYHSITDNQCKPFQYGGCQGNKNRFKSFEKCTQKCPPKNWESICSLPPSIGDCSDKFNAWHYNPETDTCELFEYSGCGGNGNRFIDSATCEKWCQKNPTPAIDLTDICNLPPSTGECSDKIAAWNYKPETDTCELFIYSGCGGNGNHFIDLPTCEKRCKKNPTPIQDICSLPLSIGDCSYKFDAWYYQPETDTCQQFIYSGCGGNGNHFIDLMTCEKRCKKTPNPIQAICSLPGDRGQCQLQIPRWYHNPNGVCEQFLYTGCGGNNNNFESMWACATTCGTLPTCDLRGYTNQCGPMNVSWWQYVPATGTCQPPRPGECPILGNAFETLNICLATCRNYHTSMGVSVQVNLVAYAQH